ncbi:hypothetical protein ACJW31_08G040300 [Castanea mollissima]
MGSILQVLVNMGLYDCGRWWRERSNELDIPEIDPSCLYFTMNHLSESKLLFADKEKMCKVSSPKKSSDTACIIPCGNSFY